MAGEKDIVEKETEPMDERPDGPYQIEQCQENNPFSGKTGFGIICGKEGSVCGALEQAEVILH